MICNVKTLGLALVAVFAMSAFVASAAQATTGAFSWDSGTTKLDGTNSGGDHVLTITAGTIKCNIVTWNATVSGTSSASVTGKEITYDDAGGSADVCRGPLGTVPGIEMNGCHYRFNTGTTVTSAPNGHTTGTMDIVNCSNADKSITTNAPGCILHFPEQNGVGPVTFKTGTNATTGKEDLTIAMLATNLKYKHTGFVCGNGEASNGKYEGNFTITGTTTAGTATNVTGT
jgi:hypothetical protein